jgi:PAS domain S-box-containing protein
MSERIQRWLAPPIFPDEDRTRAANLLNLILWTMVAITLVYTGLAPWTHEQPVPVFVAGAVLMPLWFAGLFLIRRGRVKVVGIALTAILWIVSTAIAVAAGGVSSPSLLNYTAIILIAALVLGGRAGIAFAALSIAAGLVLLGVDLNGLLPAAALTFSKTSTWAVLTGDLAVAAVLLHLATRDSGQARERIHRDRLALAESEARYRSLFRDSPISLWEEDFSEVRAYLDDLRRSGVSDLDAYLKEHPEIVSRCAALVRVLSVNQITLDLLEAESEEALLHGLRRVFTQESFAAFRQELVALAQGSTKFICETVHQTLTGNVVRLTLSIAVAPGHEDSWSKVFVSLVDVTDRWRAEEALRESEERFRSLFENAVMGLYRATPDGQVLMANPALLRIAGYSSFEELAAINLESQGYPSGHSRAAFRQEIEAAGQIIGMEFAWRRSDGSTVHVRENARAIRDQEGNTLYYEGTIEDISEQKRAAKALQENELRYRALFERTSDAVFILDLEGRYIAVNQRAADMIGYSRDQMIGMSAQHVVIPDEYSHSQDRLAALKAGQSLPVYERTLQRKDGTKVPVEINAALVYDPAGQPLHIQSVVRDISSRKRAEAEREQLLSDLIRRSTQLVTAAEVSTSASTILDPDKLMAETVNLIQGRFGFYYVGLFLVDEAGEYARLRAGTGQAGQEMLAAGHKLAVGGESMVGTCVARAEPRVALDVGEEAVRFKNPHLPQTRSELALPLISRGQCLGALTVQSTQENAFSVNDIAALQSLADQLAIALSNARLYEEVQRYATRLEDLVVARTAELAAVNKELEAFAYSVSHDLRAPLRSIDGFGQALLEDYAGQLDAVGQDYVRRMRAASQRMGQLIDDLLKLSRLTRRELHREPVDLSAMAAAIAADLQQAQPGRQVQFAIAGEVVAYGDEHLLRVMLENLLGNAWKFTSRQPQARIQFGAEGSGSERLYFVRDDGAGFDMTYANKLFAPFQRLHNVTEFEGSGIGLATVQRIVHRHGGRVWAEGAEGQGATFFFTLPTKGGESA